MVTTEDLARRSKPVLAEEGLYNWIGRDPHKDPEIELTELRGGLLQRLVWAVAGDCNKRKPMGKPASYKNLALEQRKAAKRARKEARRKSKSTADVILAVDQPALTPGMVTIVSPSATPRLVFSLTAIQGNRLRILPPKFKRKRTPDRPITPPARSPGW
jgi:hypothetical protein